MSSAALKGTYTISEIGPAPDLADDDEASAPPRAMVVLYPVAADQAPHDTLHLGDARNLVLYCEPNKVEKLRVNDVVEVSFSFSVLESPAADAAKAADDAE